MLRLLKDFGYYSEFWEHGFLMTFVSFLAALMEEWLFEGPYFAISEDLSIGQISGTRMDLSIQSLNVK